MISPIFAVRSDRPFRAAGAISSFLPVAHGARGQPLFESLLMIEKAGLGGMKQNSEDYLHLLIEVIKCTFADREYYYGDPDFIDVPLERLHGEANHGCLDRAH